MTGRDVFETREWDAAGRLGELRVPRVGATVETPALLPVVNPNVLTIEPATLHGEFDAQALITNGYIVYRTDDLRERALAEGLHDMLAFPGPIMTDSGSFQLSEYGEIDVDTREILAFQREIGSDIATPVDVPTPPDADRETAERDLETTETRLEVAERVDAGEMLVTAPVQGSTYPDLRERAGRHASGLALDLFPVGAAVPLLNDYRFADLVDVVVAAKRGLGGAAPVHLFGAGHPMMFALAAVLGCDLFDSAAYAIYARDDRYLTVRGTQHLEELEYAGCPCPVCTEHGADGLRALDGDDRERTLARHNLYVSFAEMRRVRQALRRGTLLELVDARARGHPAMLDGYRALLDRADWLERFDAVSKDAFFHLSPECARRPEVRRHHDRLARLDVPDRLLLTEGNPPASSDGVYGAVWRLRPDFGPAPRALGESYPLTAELPDVPGRRAYEAAADGVRALAAAHDVAVTVAHRDWPASALDRLPDPVGTVDISRERDDDENGR